MLQAPSTHALAAQLAEALAKEHAVPQAPQCAVLARVSTSQPLAALPSQLPKPVVQVATAQTDPEHRALALARLQVRPQPPQWVALVRVSTSQPLDATPSHSAKPAVQVRAHIPVAQAGTALGAPEQAMPQVPQWETLVRVSVSQPLGALPSQSPKPAVQAAMPQAPAVQAAVALAKKQAPPQRPQCDGLLRVSTSQPLDASPSQFSKPALQAKPQAPAAQVLVALARVGHAALQAPQWARSLWVLASQPSPAVALQSAKGAVHVPTAQLPLRHAEAALGTVQRRSQAPQAAVLDWVSTQAPEQQVCAEGQARVGEQPVTQRLPTQRLPGGQCSSVTQSTQARVAVSQRREEVPASVAEAQASSERQPGAQVLLAATQYWPVGQVSAEARHCTQAPVAVSQTAPPALPAQSALVAQRKGTSTGTTSGASVVTSGVTSTGVTSTGTSRPASRVVASASSSGRSLTATSGRAPSEGPPTTELPVEQAAVARSARAKGEVR